MQKNDDKKNNTFKISKYVRAVTWSTKNSRLSTTHYMSGLDLQAVLQVTAIDVIYIYPQKQVKLYVNIMHI